MNVARITQVSENEYRTELEVYSNMNELTVAQLNAEPNVTLMLLTDTSLQVLESMEVLWSERGIKFNKIADLINKHFKTYCNE